MSDAIGMFEHADHATPRREHGYCTDDMARLLIVTVREPEGGAGVGDLRRLAFRFLASAQSPTGRIRNRREVGGRWEDRHGVEDCWGRSVWAFGTAARGAGGGWLGDSALACFNRSASQRSPHRRSMAFAALGAAEVVAFDGAHRRARELLADAVETIGPMPDDPRWPWPEPRLTYANAAIPEALIAAGDALGRPTVVADGLRVLSWMLDRQTVDGQPEGGWVPGERLALPDALEAYTAGSAFVAFAEHRRGRVEPGMDADLAILDRDLLALGPSAIIGSGVRATVFGGAVVHRSEELA